MENVSAVTSFILTAYTEMKDHEYVYFTGFLLFYIMILFGNGILIAVIYIERGLHAPMYLFICNLAVNAVYGSTSLLPPLLAHLLSQNYEISVTCCLIQIYCLHTYGAVEFTILAVMGYDRYIAICHPLHYHLIMSPKKVYIVIGLSWFFSCLYFCIFFILTLQYTFCDRNVDKVYCSNFTVVKRSCADISIHSIVGLAFLFVSPCSQVFVIIFSYVQILRICLHASKESQTKAIQTCTPHLLTVINFALGCLFEAIQSRFNMSYISYKARIFLSIYFVIVSAVLNPVIYGVGMQAIRVHILRLCSRKKNKLTPQNVMR